MTDLIDAARSYSSSQPLPTSFDWTKNLRFVWEKDSDGAGNLRIHHLSSTYAHGYSFSTDTRPVVTPLTDRVFATITTALKMHIGTAPSGVAGSGKNGDRKRHGHPPRPDERRYQLQ